MSGDVRVYKADNRIFADIPYDNGAGVADAKRVPGVRPQYDSSSGHRVFKGWTYPLSIETCRRLRGVFGKRLRIDNDLAEWARVAIAAEQRQIELRSADDAELDFVELEAPALAKAMSNRKFQRVGARFIADGRTVLIADEPGLGKTLETLAGVIEARARRVLIFAKKKAAETVWGAEIPRWIGDKAEVYVATGDISKAKRDDVLSQFAHNAGRDRFDHNGDDKIRFLVCNIEMARQKKGEAAKFPQLFEVEWDAIVVDESHKALIGKHTMSQSVTQTRYGFMKLPLRRGGMKIALSGTPSRGKSENIWGTMNWLRPDLFTSYWRFVESYFDVKSGYAGSRVIGDLIDPDGYDRALAPYLLRRTKAEVAADMPPRQYGGTPLDPNDPGATIGIWLDLSPAQRKAYGEIMRHGETLLESGTLTANGVLAELTRLKQFAVCSWDVDGQRLVPQKPSAKYDWLKEFIEERAAAGLKVVVASQFTRIINAFSVWLKADGIASYVLTGETSERALAANVAAFNDPADAVPVMLINTMAGGESINLDACADDVVFLDETFIPDDQEQVENRVHRMSRIHQVNVWYVRSRGTVEEDICRTTAEREGAVKARLDGSRGVSFFRTLMESKR